MIVVVPLALIVVIVAIDLANGPGIRLGPLLIVAPALTASFGGPWLVALIGLLAVGGELGTALAEGQLGSEEHQAYIISLVLVSALIAIFSAVRERHREQLNRVRAVAETVQQVLMRPLPERIGPLRTACLYLTAEEEAQIGGDLYGAARIQDGTRLMVGDVRGKGLESVDAAALVVGAFWAAAHHRASLPDLVAFLDEAASVVPSHPAGDAPYAGERFVTATILDIPDDEPVVHIVSRGHPPPLVLSRSTAVELYPGRPALPLGVGLGRDDAQVETFPFEAGDILLLYTDGVTEARDAQGRFYPLAERVARWAENDPSVLIERLREDLRAYVGGHLNDDAAAIAVRREPGQK